MPLHDLRTTQAPPHVQEARGLLLLIAQTTDRDGDRLLASSALAQLDDVHPPYPPTPRAVTPLRGAPLVDETIAVLITAVERAGSAAERARALLAVDELTTPLTGASLP